MRDDLKQFENRKDDWLARERQEEARVSAWDLDDASKLKEEHHRYHRSLDEHKYSRTRRASKNGALLVVGAYLFFMFIALSGRFMFMFAFMPLIIFVLVLVIIINTIKGRN